VSEPVELGFRQRLTAMFGGELGGRVFENAAPPDTPLPYATYRRVSPGADEYGLRRARLQVVLVGEEYAAVKRLQGAVEAALGGVRREWMSGAGIDCPVWVYRIRAVTMPDVYQSSTRRRLAISDFDILYGDGR
jgi:hypothetical protein